MIREFDDLDCELFCGATKFNDGKEPIVDPSDENLLFIGSGVGCEVFQSSLSDPDPQVWAYYAVFPTQAGCKVFLAGLPGTIEELEAIGFQRIT